MKVKCARIPLFWGHMITFGKEYEVEEVEGGEFWVEDDNGEYNPIPQECFEVVSQ